MNKESVEWKNWVGLKKKEDDINEEPKKQEDTKEETKEEPFQERIVEEVGKSNGSQELDETVKVDKTTK